MKLSPPLYEIANYLKPSQEKEMSVDPGIAFYTRLYPPYMLFVLLGRGSPRYPAISLQFRL